MAWLPAEYAGFGPQKASGLLGMFGVQANPFTDWLGSHSNTLTGLGAGLVSGQNFSQGVGLGLENAARGRAIDLADTRQKQEDAKAAKYENQTIKWVKTYYPQYADLPPDQAFQLALSDYKASKSAGPQQTSDIQNYEYGLTHPDFAKTLTQKGGAAETALVPNYGTDTRWINGGVGHGHGRTVLMQLNKAGQNIPTQMPPGVQPIAPDEMAGLKKTATVDANTAAVARSQLPGVQQAYMLTHQALSNFDPNNTSDAAQSVRAGEGEQFSKVMGIPTGQMLPAIGGTHKANFRNIVDQLSGQAFLNIRQALKGAGQVTDFEGAKGEIALSRMKAAADAGDEPAFKQALFDYSQALDNGMQLLNDTAAGKYSQRSLEIIAEQQGGAPGPSASGHVLTYNPATGELE